MKKTIYTVCVDNYAPEITKITHVFMKHYATRCNADFVVITDRKFPGFPCAYEKLQVHKLSRKRKDDWSIVIDSDALVHPETIDFTNFIQKDTVMHHGTDPAFIRWRYDRFMLRDGRNIGSCNWFTIGSDWCYDLWEPLSDITMEEAISNIYPTVRERNTKIIDREHLLDDYVLSRNIAKYGFKVKTVTDLCKEIGLSEASFFWHIYEFPKEQKLDQMKEVVNQWGLSDWVA